jgi:YD repeat-containing protein
MLVLLVGLAGASEEADAEGCWKPYGGAGRIQPWAEWLYRDRCFPTAASVAKAVIDVATAEDQGCWEQDRCFDNDFWLEATSEFTCQEPPQARVDTVVYCGYRYSTTTTYPSARWISAPAWFAVRLFHVCPAGQTWLGSSTNTCGTLIESSVAGRAPPSCAAGGVSFGNPIHPLTASKREVVHTSLSLGGVAQSLVHDTALEPPLSLGSIAPTTWDGRLGLPPLWSATYHRRLLVQPGDVGAIAIRGNGHLASFRRDSEGVFRSADPVSLTRVSPDTIRLHERSEGTIEDYSSSDGRLLAITTRAGMRLVATYSVTETPASVAPDAGRLISIIDPFGRAIRYEYERAGAEVFLARVIGPASDPWALERDGTNRLVGLRRGGQLKTFLYEDSTNPRKVTGLVDESGRRTSTFRYAAGGQVVSTSRAGMADRYDVAYGSLPTMTQTEALNSETNVLERQWSWNAPTPFTVSSPLGAVASLTPSIVDGIPRVSTRTQPAGAGCAAAMSAMAYDVRGNVVSEDDFTGSRVCRGSDMARDLEVSRVEGLPMDASCGVVTATGAGLPLGARKVSTQWHPDWRLAARVAEPLRLTTKVYNGQADPFAGGAVASCAPGGALLPDGKPIVVLCREVEQATTDANGAQGFAAGLQGGVPHRERRWTYNQWGQVLTARGPRTDVDDTTTYAYHGATTADYTMGDLQQVTNAAGQVTRYPRYDRHGQMLRSIDPNGIVTEHTYDLRQRLTSTTVGGRQTVYTYDPTGQLIELTLPDTTKFTYGWDDAQRLTKITDQAGNSVTYTLDNAGKRTKEEIKTRVAR